ncbi:MAG TPA: hypothetical protein VGS09_01300 [Actinomycetota bacterium]|nr:hypothetical protein [Actinomycetota bacterium]
MQTERGSNLHEENLIYLRSWAGATEREIQDVIDQIAPFERWAEKLRERLDLINRLANLVESELKANEPVTTIDLTREAGQESGEQEAASQAEAVEGLRQIFDLPS